MGKKKGKGQGPAPRSGSNSISESVNTAGPAAGAATVNAAPVTTATSSPAMPIPISAAVDKKSSPSVGTPPALPKSPLAVAPLTVSQLASSPLSVTTPPIAVPIQPSLAKPNDQGPKPSPPVHKPSSPMTKTAPISFPSMPQSPTTAAQLGTSPSRNVPAMQKGRQSDFTSQTASVSVTGSPAKNSGMMNIPIVGSPAKNSSNINASIIGSPGKGAGILNSPIIGSPSKSSGIMNAPVIGSPGKNSGLINTPVKLSDIGITPISPKSPGSPKVDAKFISPLQRISDEPKKDFAKVDQKPKDQEKLPTPGETPIDEKKLSPKNSKGQQKTSPKVERKAQTTDKKPADITTAEAQTLPFIKKELKMPDSLQSMPLLTDFTSFLSSTTPSVPPQSNYSAKVNPENKPFLPPMIPLQAAKQQTMEKKSTEVKSSPISQPPLSLESLLGNITAKDLTKDTQSKPSPLQQLPVAEIKGVAKDIKNAVEAKQQPKAPEKPLAPAEKPASQQKQESQGLFKKDIEEFKKVAAANVPKTEDNSGKDKTSNLAPTSPSVDESNKSKDNKQPQKPEIPKKPAGLKPSKQQTKPEAVQKPKTDDLEQKNVPQKNQQPQDDVLNNKTSTPEVKAEKEQAGPKSEKLQLAPEVPTPVIAKISTILPVKDQQDIPSSPKPSTPPNKIENNEKTKPEAPKKEENTTKGKDLNAKKGKNAQKNTADDFLKERKVSSSETAESKGKNEKDSPKNPLNDNAINKIDKQDKAVPKEAAPTSVSTEKTSQKAEDKKAPEGKKSSESQGKQPQSPKGEAKPLDKISQKDDKQEKNEPKKKAADDGQALDKSAAKDQKADQPKGAGAQQKQTTNQEKGNKKDKNPPKDVKVQKEDKSPAKEEVVVVQKEEKGEQKKAKEEKSPPFKDNKEKSPKSNESEKQKKEHQKGNKPQELKSQGAKTEQTVAESTATIKDDKKSENTKQQQKKSATQDETKPQGKQGPKDKKMADKSQTKETEPKSEVKPSTESDKNTKDKAENKKTEKPSQQPAKPKVDKQKADNKPKPSDDKVSQQKSAVKVEVSLSDEEDLEQNAGDSPEVTAAKKKRRRRKKNKKPVGTAGAPTDTSSDKPKPPENKPQKTAKDIQQTPNKPQENNQGTKIEKPAQPKQEKLAQPRPEKTAAPTEQSKPSSAPNSAPAEAKQGENEGQSQDSQSKKKKNKKKKQGPGGTENSNDGQNDSAGQKKTPFEFQPPKLTLNPLAHHLSNCCCICKTTSGNNNSPLLTCTACSLACYCCREHQKQHWSEHKDFCTYISSVLSKERPYFFTPAESLSQDERRHFRLSELQLCQKALNRSPTPLESALILHPRACYTCYKPAFQNSCLNCYSINFCCQEHFPQNHLEWCSTLRIKLLFVQSQNQFGSAGVIVPCPFRVVYPALSSNMNKYLERLDLKPINKMPKELYLAHVSELATYPLTLLHALQLLSTQGATNPPDYEHLVVHVVGAEDVFECCQILKWEYFFVHLLPKLKTLHLVFIGCELTIEDEHVHVEGRLVYEFHAKMTYLDYCKKGYIKPSIVCAFNSGLYRNSGFQGTDSWGPSLCPMLKINPGAPVLFTAYTHMESQLDLQRVKELFAKKLQIVQLPLKNPFASIFPNHNLVSESECPVAFRNYYLTIVRHA